MENLNKSPRFAYLKVSVPALIGFKTRKLNIDIPIKEIIESINKTLPPNSRCALYQLHFPKTNEFMENNKTLADYNVGHMDIIELIREPKYELCLYDTNEKEKLDESQENIIENNEIQKDKEKKNELINTLEENVHGNDDSYKNHLFLDWDIKTRDAINKIGEWILSLKNKTTDYIKLVEENSSLLNQDNFQNNNNSSSNRKTTWLVSTPNRKSADINVNKDTKDNSCTVTVGYRRASISNTKSINKEQETNINQINSTQTLSNSSSSSSVSSQISPSISPISTLVNQNVLSTTQKNTVYNSLFLSTMKTQQKFQLKKKLENGMKQELIELKQLYQYQLRSLDILEISYTTINGEEETVPILVLYSPLFMDNPKLLMEYTKKEEQSTPTKKKTISIINSWIGRTQNENEGVGLPYNVKHKFHVDFNFVWSGQKPEELFELRERIGEGAYGSVWLATHKETGFELAIKMLPVNEYGKNALQKEVDALKKCKSPNILSYFGSCATAHDVWILIDYCAVGSVKDLINLTLEPLEENQIAEVCLDVLKGLEYLHKNNIIHLDIKAANIMLTHDGIAKLGDFGVCEQLRKGSLYSDTLIGSPLYMAPEIIQQLHFDNKVDIWSFGITVIEMAEGRPPNNDIQNIEKLIKIVERPPPTLKKPSLYSKQFNEFISRCLIKEAKERPTALELLNEPFIQSAKGPEVLHKIISYCLKIRKEKEKEKLS